MCFYYYYTAIIIIIIIIVVFIISIVMHIFSLLNTFLSSFIILITGVTVCMYSASRQYVIKF